MSKTTNIGWCDSTANCVIGCDKVSEGCKFCYAAIDTPARVLRHRGIETWGHSGQRVPVKGFEANMLAMNRRPWICDQDDRAWTPADISGLKKVGAAVGGVEMTFHRRRIFCDSNSDWLDEKWPIETFAHFLDVLRRCPDVTLILCTKRPGNFFQRMEAAMDWDYDHGQRIICGFARDWAQGTSIPQNIVFLTSVENQAMADKRIPELLKIPAACRGLSIEPCIGPVNVVKWLYEKQRNAVLGDGGTRLVSSGQSGQDLAQPPIFGRPNSQRDKNTGDASRAQQVEKGRVSASLVSESGLLKTTEGGRPQNLLDGSQSPPDTRRHGDKPQAQGRGQIQKPSRQSGIGNEIGERDSLLPSSGAQTESADRREKLNVETHGGTSDKNSCALENQTIQPAGNRDDVRCESDLHIGRGKGQGVEPSISWLIIGCESGPHRRDCKLEWVRSLAAQGKSAGVATFVKQLQDSEGVVCKDVSEFPEDLQVQQWPKGY